MTTTVVNIKKSKCDILIAYTKNKFWGNPHYKFDHENMDERMISLWRYLIEHLLLRVDILVKIPTLKDKRLCCYCAPDPCHGHILAYFADNPEKLKEAIDKTKQVKQIAREIFNHFNWKIPTIQMNFGSMQEPGGEV